tara:strand:- start:216 stop:896 length:681 start_codon:yes stop_codon:yes gene_type:complete
MALKSNNCKFIFTIILSISLTSCGGHAGIYEELALAVKDIFSAPQDLSAEQIDKVPYASMQVRLGRAPNVLVVLEEDRKGLLKWTSSNQIKIYTKNGKIIRLTGTENELDLLDIGTNHPLLQPDLLNSDLDMSITTFYTFRNPNLYNLPVKTNFKYVQDEVLTILDQKIETLLFKETSEKNDIFWEFTNFYWVNKRDKTVLKSVQSFTPKNPQLFFTITRKYKKPE